MLPTTILIDDRPRCVVRPTDNKDLNRFLRNGKSFLLAQTPEGKVTHRPASELEVSYWRQALALHKAWGGEEESFFGVPLTGEFAGG
ncbi:hypothetical protein [Methylocystis sp.]|uniref:hypothetical protein n=1 Tax=Methylocystis sp. TaxID=1911079 RepID=UPI003D12AED0